MRTLIALMLFATTPVAAGDLEDAMAALAHYRGASVSVTAAEAFCVIRELW